MITPFAPPCGLIWPLKSLHLTLSRSPIDNNVNKWKDIVGLRADGTVIAVGKYDDGQCNVGSWDLWD